MSLTSSSNEPPRKKAKLLHTSAMSQNDNAPRYQSMDDLNFTDYKPMFSREHLQSCDASKLHITLTPEEKQTFAEIKNAINNKSIFNKSVIVRCAGGWVRDKLLKSHSNDIDLAIDSMTGEQFGECLQKYFELIKNTSLHIGKIDKNPDKSKHLASVTFKIGTIEFDVVNLRTETYTEYSRIPVMAFGSAEEDAFRRDLTINALFYNLNDEIIEDFTRKGINDMIHGIARTPLNSMITYKDDPLRVLRNIRHGVTRFGFLLHDDIIIAAQHPDIHQLLRTKVSRERFGIEFEKMLKGCNVWIAMHCLIKLGLAPILFEMPNAEDMVVSQAFVIDDAWKEALCLTQNITQVILQNWKQNVKEEEKKESDVHDYDLTKCFAVDRKAGKEIQKEIMFAALMFPFHEIQAYGKHRKKKKMTSLVMYFVMHSIPGMPNATKLAANVTVYHNATQLFVELLLRLQNGTVANEDMSLEIGKFLRLTKENWKYCMLLVKSVCNVCYKEMDLEKNIDGLMSWIVTKSNLIGCWTWKPLLNGKQLLEKYEEFGLNRDWRIGKINEFILEQRLSKPSTTIQDLNDKIIEWLKNNPVPVKKSNKKSNKKKHNK